MLLLPLSTTLTTARATSAAPLPPSAQWSAITASTPSLAQAASTSAISASVSALKRLIEITGTQAELLHVLDMALQVGHAGFERLQVLGLELFLLHAAMHLERADGGDQHDRVGLRGRSCGT